MWNGAGWHVNRSLPPAEGEKCLLTSPLIGRVICPVLASYLRMASFPGLDIASGAGGFLIVRLIPRRGSGYIEGMLRTGCWSGMPHHLHVEPKLRDHRAISANVEPDRVVGQACPPGHPMAGRSPLWERAT